MQAGSKEKAVKRFELDNFKMEVQKKTSQEFQDEGANHISINTSSALSDGQQKLLQVEIPYDPLFSAYAEDDIIFASSFSSETGSKDLLT